MSCPSKRWRCLQIGKVPPPPLPERGRGKSKPDHMILLYGRNRFQRHGRLFYSNVYFFVRIARFLCCCLAEVIVLLEGARENCADLADAICVS